MDKALKQRLVGASVLIILAVIVLPMLLGGRSDTLKQESRQIELPTEPDELSFETRRFPVDIPGKPAPSKGQQVGDHDSSKVEAQIPAPQQQAVVTANPDPVEKTDKTPGPVKQESDLKSPAREVEKPPQITSITLSSGKDKNLDIPQVTAVPGDMSRYLVQVASFSSEKNANVLASRLRAENLPVLMDVVDRVAGRLHRVRVGPYAERSEADAVVSALSSKIKDITPRVLDLRPAESAPVSTPSDPLVRWVVQVGSFSSSKSAEALVARLRLAGLTAYAEKVITANTSTYKVRIGPEIDRDKATELAKKVKTDHNLDGFVTTHE